MKSEARLALQEREPQPLAVRQPTVAEMLHAVVDKGVTAENVGAVEKIVELYERMETKKAAMSASRALRELQTEAKHIVARKAIPDAKGGTRYTYAPYEDIMDQAQPLLTKYCFSVRFSQRMETGLETVTCILTHDDGHAFTNEFTVRVGNGPPGATPTQADSSAGTVAQREAFCDALNIVRRTDDDARLRGANVTKDQAEDLKRRVHETGSDEKAFLKFAGAADYQSIPASKLSLLDESLRKKERTT